MMLSIIGFLIALAVGLTGIGGGSFTTPALILIAGLPAAAAVGTAFIFTGVLRLIAAPFYLYGKHFHGRYLKFLLQGAIPGLLIGTYLLRLMSNASWTPIVVILIGLLLAASSGISFAQRLQNPRFAKKNSGWLPWLAVPIGIESGFSSAGAGALGTVLLLNFSEMTPAEVVGTDLVFGLVLSVIGAAFHWSFGSIHNGILLELLKGGIPGVLLGCVLARKVPAQKLKMAIALIAMFAGTQLIWGGARSFITSRAAVPAPASLRTVEASPQVAPQAGDVAGSSR
ncbi:MAG: sulfite exporter TauE/SafE family protein [Acidobacteriia bacterium]|nr:sulfite exporter TauE/SafE family protein [Terriglobia bacterium]